MKLLLKKPDEDEAIRHLMERMKLLLKNVQKPWQDSEVDHHVDRRVPLTAQDLSRGLGCLRKDLQLSSWKRENKEDKEAHKKGARFQQITWSCLWPSGLWIPFCISSMESRGDCLFSCRGLRREGLPGTRSSISPQGQVFVRPNIPPLGQHVILLVLPQLDRDLPYTTIETTGFIRVQQPHSFFSAVRHCPCLCS